MYGLGFGVCGHKGLHDCPPCVGIPVAESSRNFRALASFSSILYGDTCVPNIE